MVRLFSPLMRIPLTLALSPYGERGMGIILSQGEEDIR